jgi:hypothetical protein
MLRRVLGKSSGHATQGTGKRSRCTARDSYSNGAHTPSKRVGEDRDEVPPTFSISICQLAPVIGPEAIDQRTFGPNCDHQELHAADRSWAPTRSRPARSHGHRSPAATITSDPARRPETAHTT